MCNNSKPGIDGDQRRNYHLNVETCACNHAGVTGAASSHDHSSNAIKVKELTQFDGVLVRYGVIFFKSWCSSSKIS